ncbi:MAG: Xaa-Pro dipeptidyl-peptidase [Peptostreptococcaceae bacterium]|nr:Xaa-Pro dipeptidyl-peptidase [Peptostreptococcaceae bacterium]
MKKKNYIVEKVYVETPVDTDRDGKLDLIAVYIKRPLSTLKGNKVPVLYVANPYMMSCNEEWYIPHDVNQEVKIFPQQNISEEDIRFDFNEIRENIPVFPRKTEGFAVTAEIEEEELECISEIYDHFIDRDYAAVYSGGLGTKTSEGLTITGSREETLAFKSVIDWLNGRCRAFTDKESNIEIQASWCTGNVAMSAKSYLGTMCIAVATTGVDGLKTIIPEAAISNWYTYYRYNGLNLPAFGWQGDDLDILAKYCFSRAKDSDDFERVRGVYEENQEFLEKKEDRASGNYNRFWDERNYLNLVDNIKASVFIIHGLNDWNVKTNQCIPLFAELEKRNISRKMLLHQGEHIYVYKLKGLDLVSIMERWLDYYLKGVDTGIEVEPNVLVESNLAQEEWYTSDTWPPRSKYYKFPINETGIITLIDDLSKTVYNRKEDNLKAWLDQMILAEDSFSNRIKYIWDLQKSGFRGDVRFSGTAKVGFKASIDRPTGIFSAMIVDLGLDHRITGEIVEEGKEFYFRLEEKPSEYRVITRGWMNPQNRSCIWSKESLDEVEFYHYEFEFVPTDYTIREGHRLCLILYGIDAEVTQRPLTVTKIEIDQSSIQVFCPLIAIEKT